MNTGIVACSGTHGTGKTTRALELARELKIVHPDKTVGIIQEIASLCPFPINRETTEAAQMWIFASQLKAELEMAHRCDIVVCDRAVMDAIAYARIAGFHGLADAMLAMAKRHIGVYVRVHFRATENNPYHFPDGVRDQDITFREDVERVLLQEWESVGMGVTNKKFILE